MSNTYLPGDTRQRIQDLIKSRKITQAELAERVGLSSSTLSRYLQGRTANLGDGFIIRIAKYRVPYAKSFLLDLPASHGAYQKKPWLSFKVYQVALIGNQVEKNSPGLITDNRDYYQLFIVFFILSKHSNYHRPLNIGTQLS